MGKELNAPAVSWKKNLYIIVAAEFVAIVAFSLYNPFLPLYMQELGNFSKEEAAFWSGIATGGGGLAMFLSSPFWGLIADRWGRKPQLLRAQFGGAVIVALYIFAPNIGFFVALRILQGMFTGTVTAASALVATCTPRDKLPLTMGTLMGAIFAGFTIGPLLGGFLADTLGFIPTFIITSALLALGGFIILFFARENFQAPASGKSTSLRTMLRLAFSSQILPLLIVVGTVNLGPQIVQPILPLIFDELNPEGNAASSAGLAFGLMGIITAVSSFVIGRFNRRMSVRTMLILSCLGSGLLFLPPVFANTTAQLIILFGISGLLTGGIVTSSNSLVGLAVPLSQQGIAYGLSSSAHSLGAGVGPFIGGALAQVMDLQYMFAVTAGIFVAVGVLSMRLLPKKPPTGVSEMSAADGPPK